MLHEKSVQTMSLDSNYDILVQRYRQERTACLYGLEGLSNHCSATKRATEMTDETAIQNQVEPIWLITANVVKERDYGPGGTEKRGGTKHFRAFDRRHFFK